MDHPSLRAGPVAPIKTGSKATATPGDKLTTSFQAINKLSNLINSDNEIPDNYELAGSQASKDSELTQTSDSNGEGYVYDYAPQAAGEDEYDYESPYWKPSNEKAKLLEQFQKIRVRSIPQEDLK